MTMDLTIDSLANLMIEKYGEDASFTAAERSRVLRSCGDGQSSRSWLLISRRIDRIAPPRPKSDTNLWPEKFGLMPSAPDTDVRDSSFSEDRAEDAELVT